MVALDNGRVKYQGDPATFLAQEFKIEPEQQTKEEIAAAAVLASKPSSEISASDDEDEDEDESGEDDWVGGKSGTPAKKMIEDENIVVGEVKAHVWRLYFGLNGGIPFWTTTVFVFILSKAIEIGESYWLNLWSSSYETETQGSINHSVPFYLGIYGALSILTATVYTIQWLCIYSGSLRASERLHKLLLHSVLRAPLRFFETTSMGRM